MTMMNRIAVASRSVEPATALRRLVAEFAHEGVAKERICKLLQEFMVKQRAQPDYREQDEDVFVDLLDALSGDCHPSARLLP